MKTDRSPGTEHVSRLTLEPTVAAANAVRTASLAELLAETADESQRLLRGQTASVEQYAAALTRMEAVLSAVATGVSASSPSASPVANGHETRGSAMHARIKYVCESQSCMVSDDTRGGDLRRKSSPRRRHVSANVSPQRTGRVDGGGARKTVRVRVDIIGHARIKYVCESQSCMVSDCRFIPHASHQRISSSVNCGVLYRSRASVATLRAASVDSPGHRPENLGTEYSLHPCAHQICM